MKRCNIFVVTHKEFNKPNKQYLRTIQVGFADKIPNAIRDNTENNIAYKNKNYCELTALYWIWKNDQISDICGICHYRRYFTTKKYSKKETNFLSDSQVIGMLNEYDIIVPKPLTFKMDIWHNYFLVGKGKEKDLLETRKIVEEEFPDYLLDFDNVMKRKWGYFFNMFITKKINYNCYCQWLFTILTELERRIDISQYTLQEARIFGYISELLLNVWIEHNNIKCKEVAVINTDMKLSDIIKFNIKHSVRSVVYGKNKFI